MRALVLSLLLIVLIAMGLVMGKKVKETFEDVPAPTQVSVEAAAPNPLPLQTVINVTPQVDTIQRGLQEQAPDMPISLGETRRPLGPGGEQRQGCPVCKQCPDMSKYIRMDEIPCWNCTLP